jgi:hypothetical protein
MGQKKRTKGQTMIFQNTTQKIKNRSSNTNPTKYLVWTEWVSSSCSTSGTRRFALITHPVISHEWRVWRYQRKIRSRKSKKVGQYNGQNKKDNRTNSDLQNTTQERKDQQHHIAPQYSWNIANVGSKHQPINQSWLLSFV